VSRYDEICEAHEWRVPERYNIAEDCCDKHPRDKLALIHERYDGVQRELTWGELQDLSNQAANLLESHGGGGSDLLRNVEAGRAAPLDVGPLRRRGHRAPPP
jgi:hypothetical protein